MTPTVSTLVISAVLNRGGVSGAFYTNDFVELYNSTNSPINLSGWSIQYAPAGGSSWTATNLSGSIPAHGYYLVAEAGSAPGDGSPLPTADATGSINFAIPGGKVVLVSSTTLLSGTCPVDGSIVDLLGYNTADCSEGPIPATTGTKGMRRRCLCNDTNDNEFDFRSFPAEPHNSSALFGTCDPAYGTETPTASATSTETMTETSTETSSATPTVEVPSPTGTSTASMTPTASPTPTLTASPTGTSTLTLTATNSPTDSVTPTATFTFTSTVTSTSPDLTVSPGDPVTLSGGTFHYDDLTIQAGAALFIEGAVTIVLDGDFDLQGTVSGIFSELCTGGSGQNGGFPGGGGGAGHGGAGGSGGGATGGAGGQVTETTANPVLPGCMGGNGSLNIDAPGMGGAVLILQASDGNVLLSGTIDVSGTEFTGEVVGKAGNGGASGGTINIQARSITGSGILEARGGNGQTSNGAFPFPMLGGGGGGGGIISLSASLSNTFNGTLSVQGGPGAFGAQPGGDGQTYIDP